MLSKDFFLSVKKIHISHEFVLNHSHRCEYPCGRSRYGIVYALGGSASYRFGTGERVTVAEGEVILLSPQAAYSIVTDRDFRHYTVNFDVCAEQSRTEAFEKPYVLLRADSTERIRRALSDCVSAWGAKTFGSELRAMAHLYEALSLFAFEASDADGKGAHRRLLAAKAYIEEHFAEPITLATLARLSDMSVTNFRREWKRAYGESAMQYRDSVRLHHARLLLECGYYSVSEIAKRCGFEDVSYFVRFFRKKTGVTPGVYKASLADF